MIIRRCSVFIFVTIVVVTVMTPVTAHALFWDKQEFNNLEQSVLEGFAKNAVNNYFNIVKQYTVNDVNLMKAAVFLALFITIVKFGFGQGGIKELGAYLFTATMLLLPFVNGKSLPIFIADTSDRITKKIIDDINAPLPSSAGSNVFVIQTFKETKDGVVAQNSRNLKNFNKNCYSKAVKQYQEENKTSETPKPSDQKLSRYYDNLTVSYEDLPYKMMIKNSFSTQPDATCSEVKATIVSDMKNDFESNVKEAENTIKEKYYDNTPIPQNIQDKIDKMKTASGDDLLDYGSSEVANSNNRRESRSINEWGLSLIMFVHKVVLFSIGMGFLWLFDYYIFDVVAVIKTVAAISLAFGVLYYMYFRDIRLPLTSLGVWAAANGLYIIAGVNMSFYEYVTKYETGALSSLGWLLGFDTAYGHAIITLAFTGMISSVLAGYLSWRGVSAGLGAVAGRPGIPKVKSTSRESKQSSEGAKQSSETTSK